MITVHLAEIGTRRFDGASASAAAHHWTESSIRERDGLVPPTCPAGMDKALWASIQGPAGAAVLSALTQMHRATTTELCDATGFARPTVSRVLHAYIQIGQVRDMGQPNGKAAKVWEIVESESAEAGD